MQSWNSVSGVMWSIRMGGVHEAASKKDAGSPERRGEQPQHFMAVM